MLGYVKCKYRGSFVNLQTPTQAGWMVRDKFLLDKQESDRG